MQLRVFTTGGTIDKIYCDTPGEFGVGTPQVGALLSGGNVACAYTVTPICAKDSRELTPSDREQLRTQILAAPETFILITHGTDAMTKTASALRHISGKVIILTGSMLPARFRESDALFNLGSALAAFPLLNPGVYIAMHGRVLPAQLLKKNREKSRFELREERMALLAP